MTTLDPDFAARDLRRAKVFARITKADTVFSAVGLGFVTPILRAIAGDNPRGQLAQIWRLAGVPLLSITIFLALWASFAPMVQTSLGSIPGPGAVWAEALNLHQDAADKAEKEAAFYVQVAERNAKLIADGRPEDVKDML